ncbi:MAG: hypothetical protein EA405_05845 [Rhodospirillales bacterium]|nr:MAG: hypothetical protein EA405_05845 [Rhodospirillales bacterium]
MADGRRIALLIGNATFADDRLARLFAPEHDVDALKAVLEDPAIGGFEAPVRVLFDESLMPVREAIAEVCHRTASDDLFVLYYSGHGVLDIHDELYFALRETTVDWPHAASLEATWLRGILDKHCRARQQVVILDCCHSGAFVPGRKDAGSPAITKATFAGGDSRYILTACAARAFSWDSPALKEGPDVAEGRTSLFTRMLVEGLKGAAAPDKAVITPDDLYDYVFRNLPRDAPALSPQRFVYHGAGELMLARNPARLRPDLVADLDDEQMRVRYGAVAELEEILASGERHLAAAARAALESRLKLEEHVRVYKRIEAALARTPVGLPPPGTVFRDVDEPWCPEMVVIPPGTFLMGSPENEQDRTSDEGPQHRVTIAKPFAIGRFAVTFAEYDHFCDATGHDKPKDEGWGRGRRPVINVSWEDAQAYVVWLSRKTGKPYRLPSEAEWEYACRAGTTTRFTFGDEITEKQANFGANVRRTTNVGVYPPNPWGLHDMHGNVWEWCEDCWHPNYRGAPDDGRAWGGEDGGNCERRVLRGGSWLFTRARLVLSAYRFACDPGLRCADSGFRCARVQEP